MPISRSWGLKAENQRWKGRTSSGVEVCRPSQHLSRIVPPLKSRPLGVSQRDLHRQDFNAWTTFAAVFVCLIAVALGRDLLEPKRRATSPKLAGGWLLPVCLHVVCAFGSHL